MTRGKRRHNYKETPILDKRELQRKLRQCRKKMALYADFLATQNGYSPELVELVRKCLEASELDALRLHIDIETLTRGRPRKPRPGGLLAQYAKPPRQSRGRPVINGPQWHAATFTVVEAERDRLSEGRKSRASVSEGIKAVLVKILVGRGEFDESAALQQFEKVRNAYRRGRPAA